MICQFWIFNHGFKFQCNVFQCNVCNGCHDLTMWGLNIRNTTIITVKNINYHCIIHSISKFEAIHLLKNLFLKVVNIYKDIVLNFSLLKNFFVIFLFSIQKIVDSMDIYKSLNISIRTVIKKYSSVKTYFWSS